MAFCHRTVTARQTDVHYKTKGHSTHNAAIKSQRGFDTGIATKADGGTCRAPGSTGAWTGAAIYCIVLTLRCRGCFYLLGTP